MIVQKNLPWKNVGASSVASIEFPIGMTYNRLMLKLGGTSFLKSHITNIKLKLNGKLFYEITGARLDSIQAYRANAVAATYLFIDFIEIDAVNPGGQYVGQIGTAKGVSSFTAEVTIGAATAPTLESWAFLTEPQPLGMIHALVSHPASFAAAGTFGVDLPHGPNAGHLIKRVYFFHANMTALTVKKNGLDIFENLLIADNAHLQTDYGKVPQAGLYVWDCIVNNDLGRVVDVSNAQSMLYNITVSALDAVNIYAEYLTRLERL